MRRGRQPTWWVFPGFSPVFFKPKMRRGASGFGSGGGVGGAPRHQARGRCVWRQASIVGRVVESFQELRAPLEGPSHRGAGGAAEEGGAAGEGGARGAEGAEGPDAAEVTWTDQSVRGALAELTDQAGAPLAAAVPIPSLCLPGRAAPSGTPPRGAARPSVRPSAQLCYLGDLLGLGIGPLEARARARGQDQKSKP